MKLSVITVVYNNANHIEECIKSVISQSYKDLEYIVVDGKSTDGTCGILQKYKDRIDKLISEEDEGYVHAMNKALAVATGEAIGFLHSDDMYAHRGVLEDIAKIFEKISPDSLYGDLMYVKKNNPKKTVRYWKAGKYTREKMKHGWMPPHPTFFVRRDIYAKYGLFDTDFKIAADYELILRLLYKHKISTLNTNKLLVKMRCGGRSNKSIKNIIEKSIEDYKAIRRYELGLSTLIGKNIMKLPQFFARCII